MNTRIRAGFCLLSALFTSFILKQDFTASVFISLSLYFFLESYQLKAATNSHLFTAPPILPVPKPPSPITSESSSNTEAPYPSLESEAKFASVVNPETEIKTFAEASTSQEIKMTEHGFSACVETKEFSSMTQDEKPIELDFTRNQLSLPGKEIKKSGILTQTEAAVESHSTETEKSEFKDVEVQMKVVKNYLVCEEGVGFVGKTVEKRENDAQTEAEKKVVKKIEVKDAEVQPEGKKELKVFFHQVSICGKVTKKRATPTQTEILVKSQSAETDRFEVRNVEVQVLPVQDDQEVNTTQSLLKSVGQPEPHLRLSSLEVIHDDFYQKEILLSELLYERVTSRSGQVNYVFNTHLETELSVIKPFKYPPYFISLLNWTQKNLAQLNFDLLKQRFQNSERIVKIRTNDFNVVDINSFIDEPEFQFLYFGVYTNLLSNISILIIDSSDPSESLLAALRIKWIVLKDFSPVFLLHTGSSLEQSVQDFCASVNKLIGLETSVSKNKIAYFDSNLKVYHLESSKTQTFNYIEEKVLGFELYQNYIKDEFDLAEFCKEHLKKTLKLIMNTDDSCKIRAAFHNEDYGFCVTVKYKHPLSAPESILKKEEKPANVLKVSSISLKGLLLESTFSFPEHLKSGKTKPLSALFLSLTDVNFSDLFGPSKHLENFIEIYCKVTQSNFKDELFPHLSAWTIGSYLADFIVLVIDFAQVPDLHHSDLILKFFSILKDSDKPLFILHKTCEAVSYSYSLARVTELLESAWSTDKVLLHEEITGDCRVNAEKLESIKDQMNDNLFDPDSHYDMAESCKAAFEAAGEKLLLVQNTRKRELMIKAENEVFEDFLVVKCELEPTWNVGIRESCQQSALKNIIYVSPGQYHIDKNISSTVYSTLVPSIQDHVVKIAVFSNLPGEKLSHVYLSELSYCFAQNKEDTLLIFPSSRQITTSVSNHLNTSEFNSVFLYKFIEKIADCLILSIFYDRDRIIESFDRFKGMAAAIASRTANKPILVLYHNDCEGEMTEYSVFFNKAIKEFDQKYCEWTGKNLSGDLKIVENLNEGLYAFDPSKQIIHRLVVSSSELVWKWYNGVLYKIMHNAALKNSIKPLVVATQEAFESTLKETVLVFDDENVVEPDVQVSNYMEQSWKALSSFSFTVHADILPLWTITSRI